MDQPPSYEYPGPSPLAGRKRPGGPGPGAVAAIVVTGVLVLGSVIVLGNRDGGDDGAARPPSTEPGTCDAVTTRTVRDNAATHTGDRVDYGSVPPDSGPHHHTPLRSVPRVTPPEAPRDVVERAVHNLEHGYVVVWYDADAVGKAGAEALEGSLSRVEVSKVLGVPWDRGGMPRPYVITAWGRAQGCDGPPTAAAVQEFYDRYGGPNGDAPEKNVS